MTFFKGRNLVGPLDSNFVRKCISHRLYTWLGWKEVVGSDRTDVTVYFLYTVTVEGAIKTLDRELFLSDTVRDSLIVSRTYLYFKTGLLHVQGQTTPLLSEVRRKRDPPYLTRDFSRHTVNKVNSRVRSQWNGNFTSINTEWMDQTVPDPV